jgi:tetratricopeptide (TPR) repeat protein
MSDPRIETAKKLADAGKFQEAAALLKSVVQANPEDQAARQTLIDLQDQMMLDMQVREKVKRARTLYEQGQFEGASRLVQEILKVSPNNAGARSLAEALKAGPIGPAPAVPVQAPPAGIPQPPPQSPPRPASPRPPQAGQAPPAVVFPESLSPYETVSLDSQPIFESPAEKTDGGQELPALGPDSLELLDASPLAERTTTGASPQLSPAEQAKVQEYMAEGQKQFDQGNYQDAIDAWTRIFIIDEDNQEAQRLIDEAKARLQSNEQESDFLLTEAIASFNAGEFDRSRELLTRILHDFPGHREAQYYLDRIPKPAPPSAPPVAPPPAAPPPQVPPPQPKPAPPAFQSAPAEFELEDDLNLPTGPEMRVQPETPPPPPASGAFQLDDSSPGEFSFAGFQLDTPSTAPAGRPLAAQAPSAPAPPPEPFQFDAGVPPAPGPAASAEPPAVAPPEPPPATPMAVKSSVKSASSKRGASRRPSTALIAGIAVVLLLAGLGIFLGTRYFLGGGDSNPPAEIQHLPKPQPPRLPKPETQVQGGSEAASPTTIQPAPTLPGLLEGAANAMAGKDYAKAAALYQQALGMDSSNAEAQAGFAKAKEAYQRQQAEDARDQEFLREYQASIQSLQEGDFAECLRIAWRLIYPDDTLARQLGKRDAVGQLIRDGYYNWAVFNLKASNVRGARQNLKDLLDFDKSDAEAKKLLDFANRYQNSAPDDRYRDTVSGLTYRTFSEAQ